MGDLAWGDERTVQFITNVGLITTDGPIGPNIMAAEWTHHVSYSPGLIAVCVGPGKATSDNIRKTKEFGVNLASREQNIITSVAGNYSGKEFDKIKALEELGFEFYRAQHIKTLMVKGAVVNIECKLVNEIQLGDHTMFVGEVLDAKLNKSKEPIGYHKGKYWAMNVNVEKPSDKERQKVKETVVKHKK